MTNRYKGFLVTVENSDLRDDDSESIINALKMIKGVQDVKPYIKGAEDWMMQEKGMLDERRRILDQLLKNM